MGVSSCDDDRIAIEFSICAQKKKKKKKKKKTTKTMSIVGEGTLNISPGCRRSYGFLIITFYPCCIL
jgi:hypothetical protein